jgi:hypothetical protein
MDVQNGPGAGGAEPAAETGGPGPRAEPAAETGGPGAAPAATGEGLAEDWSEFSAAGAETTSSGDARPGETSTMTVELGGRARQLPAEHDFTGDGLPDAAVETGDGRVIVFADTEDNATGDAGPDGRADQAYVVDKATGRVVGAAHVDPQTGGWVDEADPGGGS